MYAQACLDNTSTSNSPAFWRDAINNLPSLHYFSAYDPQRATQERYISDIFWKSYQATVTNFHPLLFTLQREDKPIAALGLSHGVHGHLFSETYLDAPAQDYVKTLYGFSCNRADIMELGNLAGTEPRQSAQIYLLIVAAMHTAGIKYLLFTANRFVKASVKRSGFTPLPICDAEQSRLGESASLWGSYYAGTPTVMLADLDLTMRQALSQPALLERLQAYHADIQQLAEIIRQTQATSGTEVKNNHADNTENCA